MSPLPPWPTRHPDYGMDWRAHSDAALTRLRLVRELGTLRHRGDCDAVLSFRAAIRVPCSCRLDELLATLLPKDCAP